MKRTKGKSSKDHKISGPKEKLQIMGGGLSNMNYKDCKRRAIALGMPFPDACAADFGRLHSFIMKSENKPDPSLIDQYDDWMDQQLELRGYAKDDPMRSYQLRLGFVGEDPEGDAPKKSKRIKGIPKPKKPKREKTAEGRWKGTKKAYTYELTARGFSLERITRRVQGKFPDAVEKSIKQWHRACLREMKKNGNDSSGLS
jgi:hypothetical protein